MSEKAPVDDADIRHAGVTEPKQAKWTISLSGSTIDYVTYGVVQFLRGKPYARGVSFLLVTCLCLLIMLTWIGIIPGYQTIGMVMVPLFLFIIAPLYKMVIWSGDDFQLTWRKSQARQDEAKAEQQFAETGATEDAVRLDEVRLNTYYEINQNQATSTFRWAVAMMVLGFGTIISGIWVFYFRNNNADTFLTSLTTAAGIVSNLISLMFLRLHETTQKRSFHYYQELADVQRVRIAINLAEAQGNAKKDEALKRVMDHLLQDKSTGDIVRKETGA